MGLTIYNEIHTIKKTFTKSIERTVESIMDLIVKKDTIILQ